MPKIKRYETLAEAQEATRVLGIKTCLEYQKSHRQDPRLTSRPDALYKKEWKNWPTYFGREVFQIYSTIDEAQKATSALGIKTVSEYVENHRQDKRLPCNPDIVYKDEWESWLTFFGRKAILKYVTLNEAQKAARALGIKTRKEIGRASCRERV